MSAIQSEPRAHHFVPKCWLAGFTDSGEPSGSLWVTDLKRKKQWISTPEKSGHRRDFYRAESPGLDPVAFEKSYGMYESAIAPTLKALFIEKRGPKPCELADLLIFIALQWVRVPAFRPVMLGILDKMVRDQFDKSMESAELWAAAMAEANINPTEPGASYEEMKKFQESGQYTLTARTEFYLVEAFRAMEVIVPALQRRRWEWRISPSGSFIATDNPVVLDARGKASIGFANAEILAYAANRHVWLCSTKGSHRPQHISKKEIARFNTLAMLWVHEQLYSSSPDFCFLDENDQYQTDWTRFDRKAILNRVRG